MNEPGRRRSLPDQSSGSGRSFGTPRHQSVTDPILSKRVCFYKSGDPQFSGLRMVINNRTFKTFDALLDSLSKKVPLPFGVRNITTPQGVHAVHTLDELEDGKSYICSDMRKVKPINLALVRRKLPPWYHTRPVSSRHQMVHQSRSFPGQRIHKKERPMLRTPKRLVVFCNGTPTVQYTLVLDKRMTPTFESILEYISEVIQFHVVKLHTLDGRRVDGLPGLILCSGVVVAAGREPFRSANYNAQKSAPEAVPSSNRASLRRLKSFNRKKKLLSHTPPTRKFSSSSERYIVNRIHDSIVASSFDLSSNPANSASMESGHVLESVAEGDVEAQDCVLPTEDDIEKSFRVNQDGSMTVEMKVRLTVKEEETIHWTTTLSRSSVASQTNGNSLPASEAEQIDSVVPQSLDLQSPAAATDAIGNEMSEENDEGPLLQRDGALSDSISEDVQMSPQRTPTPAHDHIRQKQASVESLTSVSAEGTKEGTVTSFSYEEQTEQYCMFKTSIRPVPKPRRFGSVDGNSRNVSTFESAGMTEFLQIESSGEEVTESILRVYEQQTRQDNLLANLSGSSFCRPSSSGNGEPQPEIWRPSTASESISMWRAESMSLTSDLVLSTVKTRAVQATDLPKAADTAQRRLLGKDKRTASKPKVTNRHGRVISAGKRQKKKSAEKTKKQMQVRPLWGTGLLKKVRSAKSTKPRTQQTAQMDEESSGPMENRGETVLFKENKPSVHQKNPREEETTSLPTFDSSGSAADKYVEKWLEQSQQRTYKESRRAHVTKVVKQLEMTSETQTSQAPKTDLFPDNVRRASVKQRILSFETKSSNPSVDKKSSHNATPSYSLSMDLPSPPPPAEIAELSYDEEAVIPSETGGMFSRASSGGSQTSDQPSPSSPTSDKVISSVDQTAETTTSDNGSSTPLSRAPSTKRVALVSNSSFDRKMFLRKSRLDKYIPSCDETLSATNAAVGETTHLDIGQRARHLTEETPTQEDSPASWSSTYPASLESEGRTSTGSLSSSEPSAPSAQTFRSSEKHATPKPMTHGGREEHVTSKPVKHGGEEEHVTPKPVTHGGGEEHVASKPMKHSGGEHVTSKPVTHGGEEHVTSKPVTHGGEKEHVTSKPVTHGGEEHVTSKPVKHGGEEEHVTSKPVTHGGGEEHVTSKPVRRGGEEHMTSKPVTHGGEEHVTSKPVRRGGEEEHVTSKPVRRGGEEEHVTSKPVRHGGEHVTSKPVTHGGGEEHVTPNAGSPTKRQEALLKPKQPHSRSLATVSPAVRRRSGEKLPGRNYSLEKANVMQRRRSSKGKSEQPPQTVRSTAHPSVSNKTEKQGKPQQYNGPNQPNMRPVIEELCISLKSIRQMLQSRRGSCLERSNSLPDFSSHVASSFGSSSKVLLAFLSVMTLKDSITHDCAISCTEALKMIDSLREIAAIEDSQQLNGRLLTLQQSASKQLMESWKSFQEFSNKSKSCSSTPDSEQEFGAKEPERGSDDVINEIIDNLDIPEELKVELASLSEEVPSDSDDSEIIRDVSGANTGNIKRHEERHGCSSSEESQELRMHEEESETVPENEGSGSDGENQGGGAAPGGEPQVESDGTGAGDDSSDLECPTEEEEQSALNHCVGLKRRTRSVDSESAHVSKSRFSEVTGLSRSEQPRLTQTGHAEVEAGVDGSAEEEPDSGEELAQHQSLESKAIVKSVFEEQESAKEAQQEDVKHLQTRKDESSLILDHRSSCDEDSGNDHSICGASAETEAPKVSCSTEEELSYYEKDSSPEPTVNVYSREHQQTLLDAQSDGQSCGNVAKQIQNPSKEATSQTIAERVSLLEKLVADAQTTRKTTAQPAVRCSSQSRTLLQSEGAGSGSRPNELAPASRSAPQSSLSFSYDSSGVITTEPERTRVKSIREMFLAKSTTDTRQGNGMARSQLPDLRAETSVSGGYQSQTSSDASSAEDDPVHKSISKGFVRKTIERLYGKKDVSPEQEAGERPPSAPKQKTKDHSRIFSPFHKEGSELSYFNPPDALDTSSEATKCVEFKSQDRPGEKNRPFLIRESEPGGVNQGITPPPQAAQMLEDTEEKTPYSLFELEDKNSAHSKCTYFSLPHASESDMCQDELSTVSRVTANDDTKDQSKDPKTWAERNGVLPAVGMSDFKKMDNKVHPLVELPPDGEVVVAQPLRGHGVVYRRVPEPDVLDLLYNFCGQNCPIL